MTPSPPPLDVRPDVAAALAVGRPVVGLVTAPLLLSLPQPAGLETARAAEEVVRHEGAVPAFLAVVAGRLTVGLDVAQLDALARGDVHKASRRDLGVAVALGRNAGTTVAAGMYLAHRAGIRLVATSSIGGAHAGGDQAWDVSADLVELGRTPVAVVCAGARSILDLPRTVEMLETYAVPVIGYRTDHFPAFYIRLGRPKVSVRADDAAQAAALLTAHWGLDGAGVVLAQPAAEDVALGPDEFAHGLLELERQAAHEAGGGPAAASPTARLARLTRGKTLRAYRAIYVANAGLAAQVAGRLAAPPRVPPHGGVG
jgi:pseudouridine-5'-phosphate glycosidase